MNDKAMRMLGLARRAGKLVLGSEAAADAVRSGGAYIAVVAQDASDRTKKLIRNKCNSFHVPLYEFSDCETLGKKLGKSAISALAVGDKSFAKAISDILNN